MSHHHHHHHSQPPPRHFANTYDDAAPPPPDTQRRALEQCSAALKALKRAALEHQDLEGGGVYVGTGGIGLMYYHLASRQWLAEAERSRRAAQALGGGGAAPSAAAAPIDVPASQIPPYLAKHTPAHALPLAVHFARDGESVMPRRRSSSSGLGGGGPARVTFLEGYSGLLALEAAAQAASAALLGEEPASAGAAAAAAAAAKAGGLSFKEASQSQSQRWRRSTASNGSIGSGGSAIAAAAAANAANNAAPAPSPAATRAQRCARELVAYYDEVVRHLPAGECEVLYGRAGYLYSLLWARRELDCGGGGDGEAATAAPDVQQQPRRSSTGSGDQLPITTAAANPLWPRTEAERAVVDLVRQIVASGREGGLEARREADAEAARLALSSERPWPPPPPLVWRWHGKRYLGAAHGSCGVLYALLSCWPAVRAVGLDAEVRAAVDGIAALQQRPGGNLPSSLPDEGGGGWAAWAQAGAQAQQAQGAAPGECWAGGGDRLVQWCHGAPGFVLLMAKAHEVLVLRGQEGEEGEGQGAGDGGGEGGAAAAPPFSSPSSSSRYLDAALLAGECAWRRGLLTKGSGSLCHGAAGNGYALLALWRATRDQLWLRRARWFAVHVAARLAPDDDPEACGYDVADRPASLYEGAAGGVCFVADALLWPDVGGMPGGEL